MKKVTFLFVLILVLIGFSTVLSQGVYEAWVARYNGPGNNDDMASALTVDDSGYVYVTGRSIGNSGTFDYATIKYRPNGDTAWVRRYNGPANDFDDSRAITVDESCNVYVTGSSPGIGTLDDYATVKYASNGDTVWIRRYDGPGNLEDRSTAVAVDIAGNIYVTGYSLPNGDNGGLNFDYATIKYNPNGDTLWVRRYNGPADYADYALALAVDGNGNVYVSGYSEGDGDDYATIKYSPDGDTLWIRRYNGPGNSDDKASAMTVDSAGNVYVTGESWGTTSVDYATIKYAPNGDSVWVRRYDGPANDRDISRAIAVDGIGNVYVTGSSPSIGTSYDYMTIKYTTDGDTVWVRRYDGPSSLQDFANAILVNNSGYVYVTGYSIGSVTGQDYVTIKYAHNGDTLWVRRYNGPGNGGDGATALTEDNNGNVYITGLSAGVGTSNDYATIKYSTCLAVPGDANADGVITLADIVATIRYIFMLPPYPEGCTIIPRYICWVSGLPCRGDWNGSGAVTLSDVIRGVNYIFNKPGGPWNALSSGACCL